MKRFKSFLPSRKAILLMVFAIVLAGGASWFPTPKLCTYLGETLKAIDRAERRSVPRFQQLTGDADKKLAWAAAAVLESFEEPPQELR